MPAVLNEATQFTDSAGKPLVNGKAYFGVQGADPTVSPITIYSDRELTTPITNPQDLDAFGRTENKVWVAGRYSIRVDDVNDLQKYQNLDNGESADKGITVLENVSGGNTITATAATTISAYEDLEQYAGRAAQVNTDAITLNIDTVGAKAVVKNHDQPILPGEWEEDQNFIVSYNETDDVFEWVNQNNKVVDFYEGTDVATATQPDIWVTDGNTFHFTGSVTVVDFTDAPNVGARRTGISDGAFTLTHGSGITLEGSANISIEAGDRIEFYADALDAFSAWVTKADGTAVVDATKLLQLVNTQTGALATGTTLIPDDDSIPQNTEGDEYMTLAVTPGNTNNTLIIDVTVIISNSATNARIGVALFQDTTADALAAALVTKSTGTQATTITFRHKMTAGTIASTTFKIRAGGDVSGTTTFNGQNGARLYGGAMASSISISEISA